MLAQNEEKRDPKPLTQRGVKINHLMERQWTSKDDKILRYLHEQRVSIRDIAERLNRSEKAIIHRKAKFGLRRELMDDPWHKRRREARERKRK